MPDTEATTRFIGDRIVTRTLLVLDDIGFMMLGLFALTGFPLFHFVWNVGFSIPDCLPPRIVGMVVSLPLLLAMGSARR